MKPRHINRLLATAGCMTITFTGHAAEITYKSEPNSTAEATVATNWVGDVAPGSGDVAAWTTAGDGGESRGGAITIASPVSWLGIRHEDSSGTLDLSGSEITLGASGITQTPWEDLGIANNIVLGANQTWSNSGGRILTVSGQVSGSSVLTKADSGMVVLSSANTYSAGTVINGGLIQIRSNAALGTGAVTVNAGGILACGPSGMNVAADVTLDGGMLSGGMDGGNVSNTFSGALTLGAGGGILSTWWSDKTLTVTTPVTGSGGLTVAVQQAGNAGPNVVLAAANTYSGGTTINAGNLFIGNGGSTGTLGSGNVVNNSALTFNRNDSYTVAHSITGTGTMYARSGGTVTLSGSVANTNNLDVSGGSKAVLSKTVGVNALGGNPVIGAGGTYGAPGTLRLAASDQIPDSSIVNFYDGHYGGETYFQLMGNSETIGGLYSKLWYSAGAVIENGGAANSTLTLNVPSGSTTFGEVGGYAYWSSQTIRNGSGGGTLSLVKTGAGTQVIGTTGMYSNLQHTGTTTITEGVLNLQIQDQNCSSPIVFNGGALGHIGVGYLTMSGIATVASNSTLNVTNNGSNNQLFFDAGLAGSANLTINNTGSATTGVNFRNAAGTYSGAMTVNNGQLGISSGAGLVLANANVTLASAALNISGVWACNPTAASVKALNGDSASSVVLGGQTLTLGTNNGSATFAGSIGGTGGIAKTGSGTQTLSGAVTYSGATTINGGILNLDYTDGTEKLSDTAVLTLAGGSVKLTGGLLVEKVASTTLGAGASTVIRNGGTTILEMGAITANPGATVNFSADSIATTTSGTVGEMLGTWATVGAGTSTRFATKNSSNEIIGLTGTAALTVNDFVDAAVNYDYALSGGTDTLTDNRTANTVRYAGTGETVELDAYNLAIKTLLNAGTGTLTLASGSAVGALEANDLTLNAVNAGIVVSAPITGTNVATVGNVTFSGDNYYSGNTVISGGTLTAGHQYALGNTTAVTLSGGTLNLNGYELVIGSLAGTPGSTVTNGGANVVLTLGNSTTTNYAGAIQDGTGQIALTKTGGGTQILSGNNTYTGTTIISSGTLQVGDGGTSGTLGSAAVENYGTLAFSRGSDCTVSNPISGTGNISMRTGNVTLSGPVECNTLNFVGGYSRTLTLSGSSPNVITSFTSNQDGHGTLILAKDPGVNALSGAVAVGCGGGGDGYASQVRVQLGNNEQIADTSVVRMGGSWGGHGGRAWFDLMGYSETIAGLVDGTSQSYVRNMAATPSVLTLAGDGTYVMGAGSTQNGGSGALNIVKSGTGTQTFGGNGIDHSGTTTVNAGRLILLNNDDTWTTGIAVASGAVVEINRDSGTDYEHRNKFTLSGAGTLEKTGNGLMDMNWDQPGCFVLMTSGGLIHVKEGTLRLGYGMNLDWSGNKGDMTLDAGTTFDMWDTDGVTVDSLNGAGNITKSSYGKTNNLTVGVDGGSGDFSGGISNATGVTNLVKQGGGIQTLSSASGLVYTGTTTVNAGTLVVNGTLGATAVTVASSATLDAGSNISGNAALGSSVSINSGGHFAFHIAATPAGQVTRTITGTLTLAGGNFVDLFAAATPADGIYTLATAATISGTPGTGTTLTLGAGRTATLGVSGNSLVLTIASGGYDNWALQIPNAADRDRGDDPDSDGFTNLQEFLFGTSPVTGNGSLTTTEKSGGNLIIRWKQRTSGATYTLQESATLANDWLTSSAPVSNDGAPSGDYQPKMATVTIGAGKDFFRVQGLEN